MENVILDTHQYEAFSPWPEKATSEDYCQGYDDRLKEAFNVKYPVFNGEWALATDTCVQWLNGFNDHRDPYDKPCAWVECPKPYLPADTAIDLDRTAAIQGPYGTSKDGNIRNGMCMSDSLYLSDDKVLDLGQCALKTFDKYMQGMFLWNFKNEIASRWDYIRAYDNGWLKRQSSSR